MPECRAVVAASARRRPQTAPRRRGCYETDSRAARVLSGRRASSGGCAGRWVLAAIRPGGKPDGVWALPKGLVDPGELARGDGVREVAEETGVARRARRQARRRRATSTRAAASAIFKVVSFFLLRYRAGGSASSAEHAGTRSPRRAGSRSTRRRALLAYRGEREMADRGRARRRASRLMIALRRHASDTAPMYALNFYSPLVADQLRSRPQDGDDPARRQVGEVQEGHGRRTCSCGARYGPREQVFDAVIDKVEVKRLGELSPREIEHDNPEIRRTEEMAHFLGQLYNREVAAGGHGHGDPLLRDQPRRAERPGPQSL